MLRVLLLALLALGGTAFAAAIDLTTWVKRGPAGNGTWSVASGGASVTQTVNGDPTFFVSPGSFINTTLRGTIEVRTTSDDDFIGFVLGFSGPAGTGNDMDFILLDWKELSQTSGGFLGQEGLNLSRVNGTITNYVPGFWGHTDSAEFDVLASDYGADRGWVPNTVYNFEILYQQNRIRVILSGGAFGAGETIFDVAGTFPAGSFGFYNYSQQSVRYAGITEEDTPPPVTGVPEPSTLGMAGLAAAGLTFLRRRRQ
ncbi:MAG: PEP-CTERM sorting domain-containing protein [Bryobacterales bacterium]|nr:PEP-CTERM sorting domain-containing protein [Bryobacterales bacterium]